ncbi:MAG: alpha/beta hydrolase [Candidatus Muiribacteriota bacterium]
MLPIDAQFNNTNNNLLKHQIDEWTIFVHLPQEYKFEIRKKYPVFYLHDGQNLFDPETSFSNVAWEADKQADKLIKEQKIEPLIIVGIANRGEKRIDDYSPYFDEKQGAGGKATEYLEGITQKIQPFINKKYRCKVKPYNTAIGGSSLGGLFSLWASYKKPLVFGKAAVISPSIWWSDRKILGEIKERKKIKLWIDMGKNEGETAQESKIMLMDARKLVQKLQNNGFSPGSFLYKEYEGATHHEKAWQERFWEVLTFLFPTK